jgi:hypothetical protein
VRRGNREAQGLGGLKIDDQLELHGPVQSKRRGSRATHAYLTPEAAFPAFSSLLSLGVMQPYAPR